MNKKQYNMPSVEEIIINPSEMLSSSGKDSYSAGIGSSLEDGGKATQPTAENGVISVDSKEGIVIESEDFN